MSADLRTREFGALLRRLRRQRSMTLAQVAAAAGVTTAHVCFVERGRSWPAPRLVPALAAVLDADPRELLSALRRSQPVLRVYQSDLSETQHAELHALLDRWSGDLRCAWCDTPATTRDDPRRGRRSVLRAMRCGRER